MSDMAGKAKGSGRAEWERVRYKTPGDLRRPIAQVQQIREWS
jgi:hypothetical protein